MSSNWSGSVQDTSKMLRSVDLPPNLILTPSAWKRLLRTFPSLQCTVKSSFLLHRHFCVHPRLTTCRSWSTASHSTELHHKGTKILIVSFSFVGFLLVSEYMTIIRYDLLISIVLMPWRFMLELLKPKYQMQLNPYEKVLLFKKHFFSDHKEPEFAPHHIFQHTYVSFLWFCLEYCFGNRF